MNNLSIFGVLYLFLGHPDSPFNCTILNQTTVSLEVECIEGFDGGQPQWFLLEVYDSQTGSIQANISNKFPIFNVNRLSPGQHLRLTVTAVNNKGKSDPVVLEGFTLKVAEKQTGKTRSVYFQTFSRLLFKDFLHFLSRDTCNAGLSSSSWLLSSWVPYSLSDCFLSGSSVAKNSVKKSGEARCFAS